MEIVIGTRKWSSWSMRPWLALKHTGAPFTETLIQLRQVGLSEEIGKHSPSNLVPVLKDGDLVLWDSLAICEYLAEAYPDAGLWPADKALRALGRSVAAEMHSGFGALRKACPMALEEAPHAVELSESVQADVRRIVERWNQLLDRSGGPFLLGAWSIADAFYTPVATRFATYRIRLGDYGDTGPAQAYCDRLLQTPEYLAWERDALAE